MILYISQKSQDDPRFGAVKLVKLLFYSDFGAYRLLGKPITGATYQHLPQGPVPKQWTETKQFLLDTDAATQEVRPYFIGNQMRLVPQREPNIGLFTDDELSLVNDALEEFKSYTATSISEFSHREWAWRTTKYREEIPYNLAWVSAGPLTIEQVEAGLEIADREGLLVE